MKTDLTQVLALTVGVVGLLGACRDSTPPGAAGFAEVDRALREIGEQARLTEAWLTAQANHEPCQTETCTASDSTAFSETRIESLLSDPAARTAEPHSRGLVRLLLSENPSKARAIDDLRRALATTGPSAALLNDLGAAHYEMARHSGEGWHLIHALGAYERALALDADFAPALFNRALVLTRLGLVDEAVAAWSRFGRTAAPDGWHEEAAVRRSAIDVRPAASRWRTALESLLKITAPDAAAEAMRSLATQHPYAVLDWTLDEVLADWATATLAGETAEAAKRLALAKSAASALASEVGDPLLAGGIPRAERTRDLARAHALLARHWSYPDLDRLDEAERELREALELFRAAESSLALVAELQLTIVHFARGAFDVAAREIETIYDAARARGYLYLEARCEWMLALYESTQRRPLEALFHYRQSLSRFESAKDLENAASVQVRMAGIYRQIGNWRRAWSLHLEALSRSGLLREPTRAHYVLGDAAAAALELGEPEAAKVLQLAALTHARATGSAVELSGTMRALAAIELRLNELDAVAAHVEEAADLAAAAGTPGIEEMVGARLAEIRGLARRATEPLAALADFETALALSRKLEYRARYAPLLLEIAKTHAALGQPDPALAALAEAIRIVETESRGMLDKRRAFGDDLWSAYFRDRRAFFDEAIALLAAQGRFELAFDYAEQARARDVLDLFQRSGVAREELARAFSRPLRREEVQARLPEHSTLIALWQLQDRLIVWTFDGGRGGRMRGRDVPFGRDDLAVLVSDLRLGTPGAAADRAPYEELYRIVVPERPAATAGRLLIVPDAAFHDVPFAALSDPGTGRYLVERTTISVGPSATMLFAAFENSAAKPRGAGALVVGNASTPADSLLDLAPLERVQSEVESVASLYPSADVLLGEAATKSEFLRLAERSQIIHYAGHALLNSERPEFSALLLAESGDAAGRGALYVHELLEQRLDKTRIVVLSACDTQDRAVAEALGLAGIVRPLFGAGVPAVVASLWAIEDVAAEEMMTRFHRHFRGGADAAEALAKAQRELISGTNRALRDPAHWGAFQVFGHTSSPFQQEE